MKKQQPNLRQTLQNWSNLEIKEQSDQDEIESADLAKRLYRISQRQIGNSNGLPSHVLLPI